MAIKKNSVIYIVFFSLMVLVVGEPLRNSFLISIGVMFVFLSTILLYYLKMKTKRIKLIDLLLLALIAFSIVSYIYAGEYSYSRFIPLMCFIECPILISIFEKNSNKIKKSIYVIYYVISIWYILLYFSKFAFLFSGMFGDVQVNTLMLGLENPNKTAMYLCFVLFVLTVSVNDTKRKIFKILELINIMIMYVFIWLTLSRTGVVVSTFFLISVLIKKNRRINKIFEKITVYIPIAFAVFLLTFSNIYSNMTFMGDSFDTGRETIYKEAIASLSGVGNILFGNYREYGSINLHNIVISVLVEYGTITLVLFLMFFYIKNRNIKLKKQKESESIAYLAMCLIWVYSSVEAAFFISGSVYAVFYFTLYYLALPQETL